MARKPIPLESIQEFNKIEELESRIPQMGVPFESKATFATGVSSRKMRALDARIPQDIDQASINEEWKHEAAYFYQTMAEVNKIINVTARGVGACELTPTKRDQYGINIPFEDDEEINEILSSLDGPGGDIHRIMEMLAINLQTTGDGFIIANPVQGKGRSKKITGYEDFEALSIGELTVTKAPEDAKKPYVCKRITAGGVQKFSSQLNSSGTGFDLDDDTFITRCWRRSPEYSQLSISSLKANLTTCKLLSKLTDLINAVVNSQISAGILIVPEDVSFGPEEETIDEAEGTEDQGDPLTDVIMDYLELAVADRSSAASIAPLLMRIKAEYADKVTLVRLSRDLDKQTYQIRQELYERLAIGMDAPPEQMSGKSNVNNWTGYQINAEFTSNHIIPLGELIADFFTRSVLWPILAMRIKNKMSDKKLEDLKNYRFVFNPKNIIARIDKATLAMKLYEYDLISDQAAVKACGFEIADMPGDDDKRQKLILNLIKSSPSVLGPDLMPLLDGFEDFESTAIGNRQYADVDEAVPENKDGRGSIKGRQTEDESKGTEPRNSRINEDKGPGGDKEDKRNTPDNNLSSDAMDWKTFKSIVNESLESLNHPDVRSKKIEDACDVYVGNETSANTALSVTIMDEYDGGSFSSITQHHFADCMIKADVIPQ